MASQTHIPNFTAAEERYEKRLEKLALVAFGGEWRAQWPTFEEGIHPRGFLSHFGPFGSLDSLILRANQEITGTPAVCFIDCITLPWCVRLGCEWNLDPNFFISHMLPLDADEERGLREARTPNSEGGLKSVSKGSTWATIRGLVDHGKPSRPLGEYPVPDRTRRLHRDMDDGTRVQHTNLSIYKVKDGLRKFDHTSYHESRC